MNSESFKNRMADLRMPIAFMNSSDFEAFVDAEFAKNDKLLTAAGLKK